MKFGKLLRQQTLKEWRFYAVDYKDLKQSLKHDETTIDAFCASLAACELKLSKFYHDKEKWAMEYMTVLEDRVSQLRETAPSSPRSGSITEPSSESDAQSLTSDDETEVGSPKTSGKVALFVLQNWKKSS
jgi:SPX domain protein involved in polyphosphate accumulation